MFSKKYNPREDTPANTLLDILSNGQWVDEKKLTSLTKKVKDLDLHAELDELLSAGVLTQSRNSVRMNGEDVMSWRKMRGLTLRAVDVTCPRFFGGIIEDELFASAPLRRVSMVTIGGNNDANMDELREVGFRHGAWSLNSIDEQAVVRFFTGMNPEPLLQELKEKGYRYTYTETLRREIVDIPEESVKELSEFYLDFIYVSVKNQMSTIRMFTENTEISSLIWVWVLEAIRRYNEKSGVPFGSYLLNQARHWVYDLPKRSYDSKAVNAMARLAKAKNFLVETAQPINQDTLMSTLGCGPDKLHELQSTVAMAHAKQNAKYLSAPTSQKNKVLGDYVANISKDAEPMPPEAGSKLLRILIESINDLQKGGKASKVQLESGLHNIYEVFYNNLGQLNDNAKKIISNAGGI